MKATEAGKIQIDTMEAGFFERWSAMHPERRVLSLHYQIRHLHIKPPSRGSSFTNPNGSVMVMLESPDKPLDIYSQEMVMVVSEKP